MTLHDEIIMLNLHKLDGTPVREDFNKTKDVKEAVKKLKERGLKKTLYPKYLMLDINDLKEIFGEGLIK